MDTNRQYSTRCEPCGGRTKHRLHAPLEVTISESGYARVKGDCIKCGRTHTIPYNGATSERKSHRICKPDYGGCGNKLERDRYFRCRECAARLGVEGAENWDANDMHPSDWSLL